MQKITDDKLSTLSILPFGKKHPVRASIEMLAVGENLRIHKSDFQWRRKTPGIFVKAIEKKTPKRYAIYKEANTGWVVKRLE